MYKFASVKEAFNKQHNKIEECMQRFVAFDFSVLVKEASFDFSC